MLERSTVATWFRGSGLGRVLIEVGVGTTILASTFVPREYGGMVQFSPLPVGFVLLACAATLLRWRAPRRCMALNLVLTAAAILTGGSISAQLVALLVTLFTVGQLTNRRTTLLASSLTLVVIGLAVVLQFGPGTINIRAVSQTVASVGFVAAIGDASRSRRAYIAGITERARYAEESKEAEARRRVAEERVSIARDLHDLVAHQIAVVSLNVGVVRRAFRDRPDDAERALDVIHAASQTVLKEISELMTVLRTSDDYKPGSRLAPLFGLRAIPDLAEEFRRSGLHVELDIQGVAREIPEAVDSVAYRALQEALTNAFKHGAGESSEPAVAHVSLEYGATEVILTVTNRLAAVPSAAAAPVGGHGLNGVRERTASVRGMIEAGPCADGTYCFKAVLPTGDSAADHRALDSRPVPELAAVARAPHEEASS